MKILIVDDSRHIQMQIKIFLHSGGYSDLLLASSAAQAYHHLGLDNHIETRLGVDLILLDIIMPDINGIETCRMLKSIQHTRDIPVIMVTGDTTDKSLQEAFEVGAADYITKPLKKVELLARVGAALRLKQETDARKTREQELLQLTTLLEDTNKKLQLSNEALQRMVNVDGLTGLANRRYFDQFLVKEWRRAVRLSHQMSLIMIDIDFFKSYNDTYGHQQGDDCLKEVAKALNAPLKRPLDLVARYGGEEFVVLLPDTDAEGVRNVAVLLQKSVADLQISHQGSSLNQLVTISSGVTTMFPERGDSHEMLVMYADKALYQAKAEGRNCVRQY